MPRYAITFPTFLKKSGLTKQEALRLIATSDDQVSFCKTIRDDHGLELTLQEASDVYETAPTDDLSN